jgi:hypothetical protein
MSLQTFKKKAVITAGSNRSGKRSGETWVPQGPFGKSAPVYAVGSGFSINGATRSKGYIGKSMAMSKNGTPFRGTQPMGSGGTNGSYPASPANIVYNVDRTGVQGSQINYVKPSVLSTKGMLEKKYKWIHNGRYPNYWVQPDDNHPENSSQWLYILQKMAANVCSVDTNKPNIYKNNIKKCVDSCVPSVAVSTYNSIASRGTYTKTLYVPLTQSDYALQVQKKCANQTSAQKPFPFAVNSHFRSVYRSATSSVNNGPAPIRQVVYTRAPTGVIVGPN